MAIRELDKIPTKALMARITAELEGLIVTDADGRYIYVNHRWSSLTGYTLDQVKGRYVRDIVRNSRVDEVLKSQKFVSGDAVLLNICTNEEVPVYCSYPYQKLRPGQQPVADFPRILHHPCRCKLTDQEGQRQARER